MRRLMATAALLGSLLALIVGAVGVQPAGADALAEIEIVTDTADPELSASNGSHAESAAVTTFAVLLIAASAVGPWLARRTAAEMDRSLRPAHVGTDEYLIRRQH